MKKKIFILLVVLSAGGFGGFAQSNGSYSIKGDIGRVVELWGINPNSLVLTFTPYSGQTDTLALSGGRFAYSGTVRSRYPTQEYLLAATEADPENELRIPVFLEPGEITVWCRELPEEGTIDIVVSGTPSNDLVSERRSRYSDLTYEMLDVARDSTLKEEEKQRLIEEKINQQDSLFRFFYRDNRDTPIAPLLAIQEFYNTNRFVEAGEELACLNQRFPNHPHLHNLKSVWMSMEGIAVGDTIPDLALTDTNGNAVAWRELAATGSYLLLDFWSSLSGPGIADFAPLKQIPHTYNGLPLRLAGISTDNSPAVWRQSLRRYKPAGIQLWDEGHRASRTLHITSYPVRFLVDPDGVVVAKGNFTELPDTKEQTPPNKR